ncbi:MAG: hypothetical protein Q9181_006555 [Wetmoreana brouardii]
MVLSSSGNTVNTAINPVIHPANLVDPQRHPEWAGRFDVDDCKQALALMKISVIHVDLRHEYTFWSSKWMDRPESKWAFELPWFYSSGSCTVLLRMGKDFGDYVLPEGDGYAKESPHPPYAFFSWSHAFSVMDYLLGVIKATDRDVCGWADILNGGFAAIVMYIPTSSEMRRRWAGPGTHGGLFENAPAGKNWTQLGDNGPAAALD